MGLIDQIYQNLGVISIIVTFLFGVMAIYFYYHPQKQKIPCYAIMNFNLIQNLVKKFEGLQMNYGTEPIVDFSATKIAFWNEGKETIKYKTDVPSADPLIIKIKEGKKILDADKIFEKNPVNQFNIEISEDKSHIKLLFDYIDQNEGVIIQILHTGTRNSDIKFCGTIEGVKKIICKNCINPNLPLKNFREFLNFMTEQTFGRKRPLGYAFLAVPIIFVLMVFFVFGGFTSTIDYVLVLVIAIPYLLTAYILLRRRIPAGFELFEEGIW